MHRTIRFAVAVTASASALAALTIAAQPAQAAATRPSAPCTAVDAPKGMNPIPASSDCDAESLFSAAAMAATPVAPATTISSSPKSFDTTNGDILAITKVSGASTASLAIGGNFTAVRTPDGVSHSAKNFAIINESTGAVLYAGNANSYVRAIASYGGTTYLGGDFTSFGGSSRARAAALSSSHAVTSWNPAPSSRVRAMTADSSGVYLGGDFGAVRKVSLSSGSTTWSRGITSGSGRALLLTGGSLYVGGGFETYNGTKQHGLVKVSTTSGNIDTGFNAHLRADTGSGTYGSYDGEGVLALTPSNTSGRIVVGVGGHAPPGFGSNEIIEMSASSGSRVWLKGLIGDCQAVAAVGATDVCGYHRNSTNSTTPSTYYAAQFNASNGAWTTWDPRITGGQGYNTDGGNGGVQAAYADASTKTLFLAGAFSKWNNTNTHQSLIAFSWS